METGSLTFSRAMIDKTMGLFMIAVALGVAMGITGTDVTKQTADMVLTDGAPALALGMEKGDPDIMDRPPRPPQEPVINREMLIGTTVQTVANTLAVLIAYWRGMMWEAEQGMAANVVTAETMAFVTLVLSELFRAYTSPSERYLLFKLGVFTNKYMQYAVGFSILLLLPVVYISALQPIFGTRCP